MEEVGGYGDRPAVMELIAQLGIALKIVVEHVF